MALRSKLVEIDLSVLRILLDQMKGFFFFEELGSLTWAFEVWGDHLKDNLMCIIQDKTQLIQGIELKMGLIEKAISRVSGDLALAPFISLDISFHPPCFFLPLLFTK